MSPVRRAHHGMVSGPAFCVTLHLWLSQAGVICVRRGGVRGGPDDGRFTPQAYQGNVGRIGSATLAELIGRHGHSTRQAALAQHAAQRGDASIAAAPSRMAEGAK